MANEAEAPLWIFIRRLNNDIFSAGVLPASFP